MCRSRPGRPLDLACGVSQLNTRSRWRLAFGKGPVFPGHLHRRAQALPGGVNFLLRPSRVVPASTALQTATLVAKRATWAPQFFRLGQVPGDARAFLRDLRGPTRNPVHAVPRYTFPRPVVEETPPQERRRPSFPEFGRPGATAILVSRRPTLYGPVNRRGRTTFFQNSSPELLAGNTSARPACRLPHSKEPQPRSRINLTNLSKSAKFRHGKGRPIYSGGLRAREIPPFLRKVVPVFLSRPIQAMKTGRQPAPRTKGDAKPFMKARGPLRQAAVFSGPHPG